ncbi:MAG: hypothetical protein WBN22_07830 [Verrucomicrobiia bacterium]
MKCKDACSAMTSVRFASLHGLSVALFPFDDARSASQIRALVTSGITWQRRIGRFRL